jgi:peptide-methionine (R)-S-oxide reductase
MTKALAFLSKIEHMTRYTFLLVVAVILASCGAKTSTDAQTTADASATTDVEKEVRHFTGIDGQPLEELRLPDSEWKKRLTDEQYYIIREAGTERPFTSPLLKEKHKGTFLCAACQLPLFTSDTKFNSGTGWPSFHSPVSENNVLEIKDTSHGMVRTEVRCARCDGHQGHIFTDGPAPSGLRYCINGDGLEFVEKTPKP